MRRIGKGTARILAVMLAIALIWGCAATMNVTAEQTYDGTYTLPLCEEKTTLTFMNNDTNTSGASFADGKSLAINALEEVTNVHIEWDLTPDSDYIEVLNLRLASQADLPDIIRMRSSDQTGMHFAKAYYNGTIIALNDLIEKYGNNYKNVMKAAPQYKDAIIMPDGAIVAFHKTELDDYAYAAQIIRKDWLDKLGLQMPTTLDEFIEVAKAFKNNDPDGNGENDTYGLHCGNPDGSMFEYNQLASYFGLHLCTGMGWAVRDGKVTFEWVTPEAKDFIQWFTKLKEADVLPEDYMSSSYSDHDARIASGKIGLIPRGWPGNVIEWARPDSTVKKNQPEAEWVVVPTLDTEYGKSIAKEPSFRRSNGLSITAQCKNPDLAYKWLDYAIYDPIGNRYNNYGIENVQYKMVDGKPVMLESEYNTRNPVADGTWWGREFVELYTNNDLMEYGFEISGLSKESPVVQSILANKEYLQEPFYPPITSLEDSVMVTNLLADINTYRKEMWVKFMNGTISLEEEWDGYVDCLLNDMQLSKVLDIYQQAYDELHK